MRRYILLLVAAAVLTLFGAGLLVGVLAGRALAQSPSPLGPGEHHHPFHDFYRHWLQPGVSPAVSCCNARRTQQGVEVGDCEPTEARVVNGGWQAWLRQESRWVEIPDDKVIREPNPTIFDAHLCWNGRVLCFKPPDTGG